MKQALYYCHYGCKSAKTVIIAPHECLLAEAYYFIIWRTFFELRMSRRELAEYIVDIFRDACCTNFRRWDGEEYILPEFDDIFTDDDSRRWFGSYMQCDETGKKPKRISLLAHRMELLDLAAKIVNPKPFRAIGQIC